MKHIKLKLYVEGIEETVQEFNTSTDVDTDEALTVEEVTGVMVQFFQQVTGKLSDGRMMNVATLSEEGAKKYIDLVENEKKD